MIVFKPLRQVRRVLQPPGGKQTDPVDTIVAGMPEKAGRVTTPAISYSCDSRIQKIFTTDLYYGLI